MFNNKKDIISAENMVEKTPLPVIEETPSNMGIYFASTLLFIFVVAHEIILQISRGFGMEQYGFYASALFFAGISYIIIENFWKSTRKNVFFQVLVGVLAVFLILANVYSICSIFGMFSYFTSIFVGWEWVFLE